MAVCSVVGCYRRFLGHMEYSSSQKLVLGIQMLKYNKAKTQLMQQKRSVTHCNCASFLYFKVCSKSCQMHCATANIVTIIAFCVPILFQVWQVLQLPQTPSFKERSWQCPMLHMCAHLLGFELAPSLPSISAGVNCLLRMKHNSLACKLSDK